MPSRHFVAFGLLHLIARLVSNATDVSLGDFQMFVYLLTLVEVCSLNWFVAQLDAIAFGHEQVEAVIRDRPDMGIVIKRETELRAMLIWSFGGQFRGNRTYWDPKEPSGGHPSVSGQAFVRVTSHPSTSAVDKCASLVFELESRQLERQWVALKNAALAAEISRDDYAVACVGLEFQAWIKTQQYFEHHPLKGALTEDNPFYSGTLAWDGDFSHYIEWLESLGPNEYNPRRYFAERFDKYTTVRANTVLTPSQGLVPNGDPTPANR